MIDMGRLDGKSILITGGGSASAKARPRESPRREAPWQRQMPKTYSMTWAQRLKRVFAIDIEKCEKCGGRVRVIASIEDPDVIQKILKHLGLDQASQPHNRSPPGALFDHSPNLF